MSTILDTIVARKKEEVAALLKRGVRPPDSDIPSPRGFARALALKGEVAIIAEAKKASPSKGLIRPDFDPAAIAEAYLAGGASAMSVLTDENFFQGSLDYLLLVRSRVNLPVIRKDFLIHEAQIQEARAYGADAILLIAAILDLAQMRDYLALACELGMDVLTEVHDEAELEKTLKAGATLIGVNNRNLRDFTVSLDTTFRLQKLVPATIPLVSESGIRDHADILRLRDAGVAAALVGESLMRAADIRKALEELRGVA